VPSFVVPLTWTVCPIQPAGEPLVPVGSNATPRTSVETRGSLEDSSRWAAIVSSVAWSVMLWFV
jgi:hypothetical protein